MTSWVRFACERSHFQFSPFGHVRGSAKLREGSYPLNTKDQLAPHTSQISRLEQVMTALAEAQVKTEDETLQLKRETRKLQHAMTDMAKAIKALAEAQAQTERQFQAYLNTRKN